MKFLLLLSLVDALCGISAASSLQFGSRVTGDKLLYSWWLEAGPYQEAREIMLSFDYRTDDILFGSEHLTMFELTRSDDLIPNYFGSIVLNNTHVYVTPVRRAVTQWGMRGNLYGLDEQPFPG
ncbi:uncharacterized protein LOC131677211 [Topomyia yanbarensis]|uniref:uncharacterized protein LOC131677211 n=1 Tax=Topomyia yanbarensis TaxID=2498891 RepID=UPI00273A95E7|nr:uncharacterized protein LOC131677211 [Topomyia yanbarensis]